MATKRTSTVSQSPAENWTDDLPVCKLSGVGFLTNQMYREDGGGREDHEFEDRSFHFNVDDKYLYGVFDGHDGTRASDFTVQRLPAELLLGQLTASMNDEQIKGAIRQAFIAVEKCFFQSFEDALAEKWELQLQMPEGLSSNEAYQKFPEEVARIQALQDEISGGTTAVLAIIFQNKLFVANVGDSRALLCKETPEGHVSVEQLSVDHVTDNKEELQRLANLGIDIQQILRNRRIGNQENTRCIGHYGVKGGYKDFDILSVASEEPVIAEPHIRGGIPIDETFFALVLMSHGVYRSIEEAADIEINSNFDVVRLVTEELHWQSNMTGVAQAVVDRIGRAHHDTYMNQMCKCQKRDDMTILIRIFKEEIANSLKSPRAAGRQTMSEKVTQGQSEADDFQRQLREMQQREEDLQRQLGEMQQREENLQRQLTLKDRRVNELQLSLATAQQTISEQRRQETCDWVIPRDEIQMTDRCLGKGGWGSVYEGKYCGCTVAVKQIHDLIISPHNIRLFEREMNVASKCRFPSLLQFIGATSDEESPLFVTELMETSLRALLGRRQLSETEIFTVSRDVAQALNYLHQKKPEPIIHRDVSSANVLLWRQGDQWRGKVSDYGTANFMQNTMTVAPGARIYSAPEALTSKQTVKVDVFSFGILLCEMCIRELPDPTRRDEQVVLVTNHVFRDLVRRCLQDNPEMRPNMQQIIDELEEFNTTS